MRQNSLFDSRGRPGRASLGQTVPARYPSPDRQNASRGNRNASFGVSAILGGSTGGAGRSISPYAPGSTQSGGRASWRQGNAIQVLSRSTGNGGLGVGGGGLSMTAPLIRTGGAAEAVFPSPPSVEPAVITTPGKVTTSKSPHLVIGIAGLKGHRPTMEDTHIALPSVTPKNGANSFSLLAVLDGHCGKIVADIGADLLPVILANSEHVGSNNAQALMDSVVQTDKEIFGRLGMSDGGSTLIACMLQDRILHTAWIGDARAVLYEDGKTVALSADHKPTNKYEQTRIEACGGIVQFGRVNAVLAVSRALGDFEFKFTPDVRRGSPPKDFMVSNFPDVTQVTIKDGAKFVIIACDGLWDALSNEDATAFVVVNLFGNSGRRTASTPTNRAGVPLGKTGGTPTQEQVNKCAGALAQHAIDRGSMDNVSVVIAVFQ